MQAGHLTNGSQPQVRQERTGWRDLSLSQRHRQWGWDCPAVDLDFLFLEYDNGKAVCIVEYKHERAKIQYSTSMTYQAMIDLANRAGIPIFAARYTDDFSEWTVTALNSLAEPWLAFDGTFYRQVMTEREWVTLLYALRGYALPPDVFNGPPI